MIRSMTPNGTWTKPGGIFFLVTSSTPSPPQRPSSVFGYGYSLARTTPTQHSIWIAHVRCPHAPCPTHAPRWLAPSHPHVVLCFCIIVLHTVGSYFALRWLANLFTTASALGPNCIPSATSAGIVIAIDLLATFGLSLIGAKLVCHRYLIEKARAMINMYGTRKLANPPPLNHISLLHLFALFWYCCSIDDANNPAVKHLAKLESSFVWEARSLYFIVVAVPTSFIYLPAALVIGGLGTIAWFSLDRIFSCVVTALFLRPIFKALGEFSDAHSAGHVSLEKTKWLTLTGTSLTVISSMALYINFGFFFVLGGNGTPWYANPYLNAMVFGTNLGSVLNDIGMLLVCGVLKKVTCSAVIARFLAAYKVKPTTNVSFLKMSYKPRD